MHPGTDDDAADHEHHVLWMGEPLPLDIDFLRRYAATVAARRRREPPQSIGTGG